MTDFSVIGRNSPNLIRVSAGGPVEVWRRTKQMARIAHHCAVCRRAIPAHTERVYASTSRGVSDGRRICETCAG